MQQIATNVFIETGYAGVTLGAVVSHHGMTMIDAPFRSEDVRSWRAALANLMGSGERFLVNLDAHYDRTLGIRAMECTVIGHENMANAFRTRSAMFKPQNMETGAEWEVHSALGGIRWAPPDITFNQKMQIHGGEGSLMLLEYCPGPSNGAIWAWMPEAGVLFLGDAVVVDQPPFLATADISAWVELLQHLLDTPYQNALWVSGRGGLVARVQVQAQINWLQKVRQMVSEFAERKSPAEGVMGLAEILLKDFAAVANGREEQFRHRLRWGLYQYYLRKYRPSSVEVED